MSQTVLEPVRMQHIAAFNFRIHSVGFVTLKNRKTFYIIDLWILYLILLHLSVTGKRLLSLNVQLKVQGSTELDAGDGTHCIWQTASGNWGPLISPFYQSLLFFWCLRFSWNSLFSLSLCVSQCAFLWIIPSIKHTYNYNAKVDKTNLSYLFAICCFRTSLHQQILSAQ